MPYALRTPCSHPFPTSHTPHPPTYAALACLQLAETFCEGETTLSAAAPVQASLVVLVTLLAAAALVVVA